MAKRKPARTGPRPAEVAELSKRSKRPAASPNPVAEAPKSAARARLERWSARPMASLGLLPTQVLPIVLLTAVLMGLLFPANWAGLLLILVGLFMAWLTALSWPATTLGGRVLRVVVNLVLIGLGVTRMMGLLG